MPDKITLTLTLDELKELDKNLYYCEETWSIFDKIKVVYPQPQMNLQQEGDYVSVSYNNTTYYRLMGETTYTWYIKVTQPVPNLVMVDDAETERLLDGLYYNHIVVKKETAQERGERLHKDVERCVRESVKWCEENPDKDPLDWLKPQTPEQTEQSLKEAFVEAQKTEKWKEIQKLIDEEDNDKNFKNSLDLIKEWGEKNKPPTLKELLWEWWEDIFTVDSDLDADASIDVLVDRIEEFLPKEHHTNSYKWNECIRMIREKLR